MDFYNEFLERLRKGEDANVIANEITKALNDSIKAKADEDEAAKKAKLDEEIKHRLAKVKNAEKDMNDYLDVMIDYVNDYLDAYAEAHEKDKVETMTKDELRSLLDSWAVTRSWIEKVADMNLNDVLDDISNIWKMDMNIKSQPSANIVATTNLDKDSLDKIFGNVKEPCKKAEVPCDCDKSVKKPIKATTVHIKDDMSADDIIKEFLKALDKF